MQKRDSEFMQAALEQSYKAFKIGEVPVGAVLVYKEEIIAKGYNKYSNINFLVCI